MIDDLPVAPDPAVDAPSVFNAKAAAFVLAQKAMVPQINSAIANFNAAAAGSAYAIPYTIDLSSTADADPGSGKLRFDSATQNAATTLRLDPLGAGNVDYTAMIDTFDASTSTVKGSIRIVKQGDASKFLMFNVTARTAPSGYRDISVTPVASSAANPFLNGDSVLLFFQRTGDKGAPGNPGQNGAITLLGSATVSTAVANIDFLNVFTSAYNKYLIEIGGLTPTSGGTQVAMRLANAGAVDTGASNYWDMANDVGTSTLGNQMLVTKNGLAGQMSATIEIRNANDAAHWKGVEARGSYLTGSTFTMTQGYQGAYVANNAASGFRLYLTSGTFSAGTVRVYGVSNS
jgi:hypothetical protein